MIGGYLVDVSPLSMIGTLWIASAPAEADRDILFNRLLASGHSMTIVGVIGYNLAFGR